MSYIDRVDAIKALRQALYEYEDKMEKRFLNSDELDIYDWSEHEIFVQNMSDIDCKTILEMPDADVEPIRHGEWVVDTIYPSGVKKFHCSICGQERTVHEKYEGVFRQNYCPNCGTKMDKGET